MSIIVIDNINIKNIKILLISYITQTTSLSPPPPTHTHTHHTRCRALLLGIAEKTLIFYLDIGPDDFNGRLSTFCLSSLLFGDFNQ